MARKVDKPPENQISYRQRLVDSGRIIRIKPLRLVQPADAPREELPAVKSALESTLQAAKPVETVPPNETGQSESVPPPGTQTSTETKPDAQPVFSRRFGPRPGVRTE